MKLYLSNEYKMASRTHFLNNRMRNVVPSICIERARIVTNSYKGTEGLSYIKRRAIALREMLEQMTIFIDDEELIVGNHGSSPRAALIFPEFGIFSKEELDLMPKRNVDTLQISEEDKEELLNCIYPYWEEKCTDSYIRNYVDEEIMKVLDSPFRVFNPLSRARSGYGHYLPNIEKIIKYGFKKIEQDAIENLKQSSCNKEFYEAVLIVCEAVKIFQNRFAELAEKMANEENDKSRKQELLLIKEVCSRVPYEPASNFHEALQSYWFTILIDYCGQNGSAISGGRVDQIFYPYYRNDIDRKLMTDEDVKELLSAFWVKHSDIIKAGTYSSARNNGGFATTINVVLGGVDQHGNDAVNELSYLCLDVEKEVFNSEPNTSIRVSLKNPDDFIKKALNVLVENEGGKLPYFNDDIIIPALVNDGYSLVDARNYAIVGCVEPTGYGNTMGRTNSCYFNLAKCLELALFDGVCQMSNEQMGPKTGSEFTSFEDVLKAYEKQVEYFVEMMVKSLNGIEQIHKNYGQHIYCSMLLDGCMESGKDCTSGGAKYDFAGVQGVGMVDVADSLTALKQLVFDDGIVDLEDVLRAMKEDYKDNEILRQIMIHKASKYGNDIDEADEMAKYVSEHYCNVVRKYHTLNGGDYRPGLFCLSSNTPLGKQVCALPSGRSSGVPLADGGVSPKHGMDILGPTASSKSVSKVDHAQASNGVNFNLKFMPTILKTESDRQKLIDVIRTYFSLGGMHIQFNILSTEKLLEAQKNPVKYRSLVVRVAGYSAFFVELDKEIQDEIISRTMIGE